MSFHLSLEAHAAGHWLEWPATKLEARNLGWCHDALVGVMGEATLKNDGRVGELADEMALTLEVNPVNDLMNVGAIILAVDLKFSPADRCDRCEDFAVKDNGDSESICVHVIAC